MQTTLLWASWMMWLFAASQFTPSLAIDSKENPLLHQARQTWKRQRSALRTAYFQFTEKNTGTLPQWDYKVENHYRVYFEDGRFYNQTKAPGYEVYDVEFAFDGENIWRRSPAFLQKTALADARVGSPFQQFPAPYFESAGFFVPRHPIEISDAALLEPAALRYLERGELTEAESSEGKLRLRFQVADQLARLQYKIATNRPASLKPSRKLTLLVDPERNYAVVERDDWNIFGKHTSHTRCDDWKYYEQAAIWLPTRCVESCFARPRAFVSEYSDQPINTVTLTLTEAAFEKQKISFSFKPEEETSPDIFARDDSVPGSVAEIEDPLLEKIEAESRDHSQVMETASWLTDVYGPRLTGSKRTKAAGEWAVQKFRSWGISNVRLETWGSYENRGWENERFNFQAIAPVPFSIDAKPMPWSISTPGRVEGRAIRFDVHSLAEMKGFAGRLKGAFLLMDPPQSALPRFTPDSHRLSETRLKEFSGDPKHGTNTVFEESHFTDRLLSDPEARRFLTGEGVAAALFTAPAGYSALLLAGNGGGDARTTNSPNPLPVVKVLADSYGRIARLLEKELPVTLALEMRNSFDDYPFTFNLIAEIPGVDSVLKDEVVAFGAHFDSWTFGSGATDNAGNCAVLMEAFRILSSLHVHPRRTIRICLWTGEEQGELGSSAYARQHLQPGSAELAGFSAYFNMDSGTGKIRGFFAPDQPTAWPMLATMLLPFQHMGVKTVSPWDIGGGDDLPFRAVNIPTFSFIQDPLDYESRTHHSDADNYDRLIPEDLKFNSAFIAALAWRAAQGDERFPR